ncbi:MAG: helix-turn-helix domain-containing protein [Longimicrobiales bacterium]
MLLSADVRVIASLLGISRRTLYRRLQESTTHDR